MSETSGSERRAAFERGLRRHGLAIAEGHVDGDRWTRDEGEAAALRILGSPGRPTALVASSVELALGALLACRRLGLVIPDDVALATFDDAYFAELLDPPLTAVVYDPEEVGRQAAELLVSTIRDPTVEPRDDVVPVRLVIRRSCGCPA
jgi:LacI family transcriptional regulator